MVYERPKLGPTANLDNRIAHAEAVVARARLLKAPQVPQQAPPVPVPVPQAPTTPPQAPSMPPETPSKAPEAPSRPPISASTAGRQAAILDNLGAMLDALLKERAALDAEIAIINKTAEDFGKLPGVAIALPPSLQIPAVKQTAQQPRTNVMETQILAMIRNGLIFGGGYFVSKGWVDNTTLVAIVGGVMSLGGAAWSAWGHRTNGIIAEAASLPDVQKVVTTAAIADSPTFAANNRVVAH